MKNKRLKTPIGKNLLTLRHRMKMTQGEFIQMFLQDEEGKPLLSVAKLSNLENRGNRDEKMLAEKVANRLSLPPAIFGLAPDEFAKNIDVFMEKFRPPLPAGAGPRPTGRENNLDIVVEAISDYLAENITAGKLQPGSRLPGDRDFAEMLRLSRSSVREALKVLSALGVIHILPGSGMYLAGDAREIFTLPFSWSFLLSTDSNQNVYQLRRILERETVRIATQKRSEPAFAPVREAAAREKKLLEEGDFAEFLRCDQEFHMAIAACAGNEILYNLLLTCRKILAFLNARGMSALAQMLQVQREHEALYRAMEEGDAEKAERLLVEHLERSEERYQARRQKTDAAEYR